MIRIMNNNDRISVEGNADYGPYGQDIVCSAISTLLQAWNTVHRKEYPVRIVICKEN
ncbi:MAG: ribosomal-processing cysteine protease Prp [[Eubacterium] sulci]|nr:ribosomal-processing cysteine protease Prp [[Eubacterium] sulci]